MALDLKLIDFAFIRKWLEIVDFLGILVPVFKV